MLNKLLREKCAMSGGKSTIKPSKKSTVMYHVTKWLLLHTYSYVVTPLQSVEKKEKNIRGLVFHVFVQLVWKA